MPTYAHASLILGEDRSKLSKRHGATSVDQFKREVTAVLLAQLPKGRGPARARGGRARGPDAPGRVRGIDGGTPSLATPLTQSSRTRPKITRRAFFAPWPLGAPPRRALGASSIDPLSS